MDINNNTQTNTFLKGMNTDTSDMLLSPELYREARNLRLSTNKDNNSSQLHVIDGTAPVLPPYTYFKINGLEIAKIDSIRDILVVIAYKSDSWWNVYCKAPNDVWMASKTEGGFSIETLVLDKELSTVLNYESDNNIYLYIADGEHPIYKVQIDPENNLNQTDDDIVSYSNKSLNEPVVTDNPLLVGLMPSGKLQYAYRLYNKHGNVTQLSPLSNIHYIYKDRSSTTATDVKTNKCVEIEITNLDSSYNSILLYRIHYAKNGEPPVITVIYDGELKDSYIDRGEDFSATLSMAEFVSMLTVYKIKPRIIKLKDNYLFAANTTDSKSDIDNYVKILGDLSLYFELEEFVGLESDGGEYVANVYSQPSIRSFRRGETYRFGLVFYKDDIKSSVFFLQDYTILDTTKYAVCDDGLIITKPVLIKLKIKPDAINTIRAFSKVELVRAERNISNYKTITSGILGLTLGIISSVAVNSQQLLNKRYPSGFITTDNILFRSLTLIVAPENSESLLWGYYIDGTEDGIGENVYLRDDVLQFVSPEVLYDLKQVEDIVRQYINNITILKKYLISFNTSYETTTAGGTNDIETATMQGIGDPNSFVLQKNGNYYLDFSIESMLAMRYRFVLQGTTTETQLHYLNEANVESIDYFPTTHVLGGFAIPQTISINAVSSIIPPLFNLFDDNETVRVNDDAAVIGMREFIPWTVAFYEITPDNQKKADIYEVLKTPHTDRDVIVLRSTYGLQYPIATTGKCLLFLNSSPNALNVLSSNRSLRATVVDIQKTPMPYDKNCKYFSYGDLIDLQDELTEVVSTAGDTVILIMEYNAAHVMYSVVYKYAPTMSTVYRIPIESYVDMRADYGTSYTKQNSDWRIQDTPSAFNGYILEKSCYLYNDVYMDGSLIDMQIKNEEDDRPISVSDARIFASLKKENGEFIDSWLQFKPADFIDLDYKYGEITDMTVFNNQLIAWQKDATSVVSVNERALVNSMEDTHIILGTADVLGRYDYITTKYGMTENQMCHAQSTTTLYWWDSIRRELLAYSSGQQVSPLTTVKGLRNYINSGSNNEKPKLLYDEKYKEVVSNVIGNKSLVYSEEVLQFTSVYDMYIKQTATVNGDIYLAANDDTIYIMPYTYSAQNASIYGLNIYPSVTFVTNPSIQYTKVYDNLIIGGKLYDGGVSTNPDSQEEYMMQQDLNNIYFDNDDIGKISVSFKTPLNQQSSITGDKFTIREGDYRYAIPRNLKDGNPANYGNRLRGKYIECTISSSSNRTDFSLQYVLTKYRISWS